MTALVTGANGLLGGAVCGRLTARGEDVIGVVRHAPGDSSCAQSFLSLDLADSAWKPTALPKQLDVVIHLAQSRRFRDFPDGVSDVFGVNIQATARLLDYALRAGATHFVYASSGGLYRRGEVPLTETTPLDPPGDLGFYLGSKAAAEILVQSYAALMNVIILRPFFVYGPRQGRDMLIPRILDNVRDGRAVHLDGENGLAINPIHVEDASLAVSRAVSLPKCAVINIAGPETLTLREIAVAFGKYLGKAPIFERSSQPSRSLLGSIDRMSQLLHAPQRRLFDSIGDVVESQ